MTERERFARAFNELLAEGKKPTPTALNMKMGRKPYRHIPGRLSSLRRQMFHAVGWTQRPRHGGGFKHWQAPRHPQNARVHV